MPLAPRGRAAQSSNVGAWPCFAVLCLGLILFLIAAAIILALIPVYLQNRSKAATTLQSNPAKLTFLLATSTQSGRRKRSFGYKGFEGLNGAQLNQAGLNTMATRLLSYAPRSKISSITVESATVAFQQTCPGKRKRRYSISKRQTNFCPILIVEFITEYQFDCLYNCQVVVGPVVQKSFISITSFPSLVGGALVLGGTSTVFESINFQEVYSCDPIVPVLHGNTAAPALVTLPTVIPTTTTVSVTPAVG